jgi:hypothetical protein
VGAHRGTGQHRAVDAVVVEEPGQSPLAGQGGQHSRVIADLAARA